MSDDSFDQLLSDSSYEPDDSDFEGLAIFDEEQAAESVYAGWDRVEPEEAEAPAMEEFDAGVEQKVYGLVEDKAGARSDEYSRGVPRAVRPVMIGVLCAAILLLGGLAIWRIRSLNEAAQAKETAVQAKKITAKVETEEPKKQKVHSAENIRSNVSTTIQYAGQGITIESSRITVEVNDGHVLITHTLAESDVPQPDLMVSRAGLRANVIAATFTDKLVSQTEENGVTFKDVTWVVRNSKGEAYLALRELPGNVRQSTESFGVFGSSDGYSISEDVLSKLGDGSGLSQSKGSAPTDLTGNPIITTAKIETEEPPAENTTDTNTTTTTTTTTTPTSPTYYDDGGDDGGDYYVDYGGGGDTGGNTGGGNTGGNSGGSSGGNSGGGGHVTPTNPDTGGSTGGDTGGGESGTDTSGDSGEAPDSGSGGEQGEPAAEA